MSVYKRRRVCARLRACVRPRVRVHARVSARIVLPAGVYFFSHDAEVIPAPIAGVAGLALIGVIGLRRRR